MDLVGQPDGHVIDDGEEKDSTILLGCGVQLPVNRAQDARPGTALAILTIDKPVGPP